MEKEIIKNYWQKKIMFTRIDDKFVNTNIQQSSIANLCKIGDKVNGYVVDQICIGMGYCYCVFAEHRCFYSWNIETIETTKGKYKILEKENNIFIEEE